MPKNKPVYFNDLSIEDMFKYHDHTYMMSDDSRYYENGRQERQIIHDKVEEQGGWTKELVDTYNKYAPEDFGMDYDLIHKSAKK